MQNPHQDIVNNQRMFDSISDARTWVLSARGNGSDTVTCLVAELVVVVECYPCVSFLLVELTGMSGGSSNRNI